jgi:hypothetical protein
MSNLSTNEVPVESTCAWTLVKKDNEIYLYRQFFANLTCGVALDISSTGFENADQVGSTFMGAFFEHCTTRPIWLNKTDHTISFNQPPSSNNYVFAWGNHRGKRKKKKNSHKKATKSKKKNSHKKATKKDKAIRAEIFKMAAKSRKQRAQWAARRNIQTG